MEAATLHKNIVTLGQEEACSTIEQFDRCAARGYCGKKQVMGTADFSFFRLETCIFYVPYPWTIHRFLLTGQAIQ